MYLHLGQNTMINTNDIVGIFDLDNTTVSKRTRAFLSNLERQGRIESVSVDLPKSMVVCAGSKSLVYITQLSPATLKKRIEQSGRYRGGSGALLE